MSTKTILSTSLIGTIILHFSIINIIDAQEYDLNSHSVTDTKTAKIELVIQEYKEKISTSDDEKQIEYINKALERLNLARDIVYLKETGKMILQNYR